MEERAKNKVSIAYEHLWTLIKSDRYQPGDMLPTEVALAGELGVNRLTIAKALNSLKNEGYVERVPGRGTTLIRKPTSSSSKLLLLVSPWPSWAASGDWYYARLLYAIQAEAFRRDFSILNVAFKATEPGGEDFAKIRDLYHAVDCVGTIVVDPYMATHRQLLDFLEELGCPSVWAGSGLQAYKNISRVDIDNYKTAFELTEKLIGLAAERIAFMGGRLNTTARKRRHEGFKDALKKAGLPVDERYVICNSLPAPEGDAGRECAGIYAARNLDADAIFLNDLHLLDGIRDFCAQHDTPDLRKLRELPVATFDYEPQPAEKQIRFSASQPIEQIGKKAVDLFEAASERGATKDQAIILDTDIRAVN